MPKAITPVRYTKEEARVALKLPADAVLLTADEFEQQYQDETGKLLKDVPQNVVVVSLGWKVPPPESGETPTTTVTS